MELLYTPFVTQTEKLYNTKRIYMQKKMDIHNDIKLCKDDPVVYIIIYLDLIINQMMLYYI